MNNKCPYYIILNQTFKNLFLQTILLGSSCHIRPSLQWDSVGNDVNGMDYVNLLIKSSLDIA